MIYHEEALELLSVSPEYHLVHCTCQDFTMGGGVHKLLDLKFDLKANLKKRYPITKAVVDPYIGAALQTDRVFSLVTRRKYSDKAKLSDFREAVEDMRDRCLKQGIRRIAVPRYGGGFDAFGWDTACDILKEVFANTHIEIMVCTVKSKPAPLEVELIKDESIGERVYVRSDISDAARFTLSYFVRVMDGKVSFALIAERVILMLMDVHEGCSVSAIRKSVRESASYTCSGMPDFSVTCTDDGYAIVTIRTAGVLSADKVELTENGQVSFSVGLELRYEALEACRRTKLLGIYFAEGESQE